MTMSVSTWRCSSSMPSSASRMRRLPSNVKGLVTTPTVRMPCSRAARAITGAAPVPVPPPMPAVMNTMCEPREVVVDLVEAFLGRGAPDFRMRARAQTFGHRDAELDDAWRFAERERLRIGVGADEIDPVQARRDHVVDGVAAGAAHAENRDAGLQFLDVGNGEIDWHGGPQGTADGTIVSRQFVNRTLTIGTNPLTRHAFCKPAAG